MDGDETIVTRAEVNNALFTDHADPTAIPERRITTITNILSVFMLVFPLAFQLAK